MPFASEKQRRYLWSQKPKVAKKFVKDEKKLPWHKRPLFPKGGKR